MIRSVQCQVCFGLMRPGEPHKHQPAWLPRLPYMLPWYEADMSEVRPALTPEEWVDRWFTRQDVTYTAHELDGRTYEASAYGMSAGCSEDGDLDISDTVWYGEARHALAAVALHGQPFGFTWEDVDALRELAYAAAQRQVRLVNPEGYAALNDLADRIAALLPPREISEHP